MSQRSGGDLSASSPHPQTLRPSAEIGFGLALSLLVVNGIFGHANSGHHASTSLWVATVAGVVLAFVALYQSRQVSRLKVAHETRLTERADETEEQRRLLDAVLDALPVAVIIADPGGRLLRTNRACDLVCGGAPAAAGVEEYLKWVGYWPDTGRRVEPDEWPLSRALFSGETCSDEVIVIERLGDRSRRTLLISAAPVRGGDGSVIAGVATGVDVTDRKQMEAALLATEERFQAFMTHAPLAAWVADADSRGVYTNPGFDRHLKLPSGAYLGRTPAELWPADLALAYVENNRRVLTTGAVVEDEEPFVHPDGSPGVAYVVKFPVPQADGRTFVGGVALDITERKREQKALSEKSQVLETVLDSIREGVLGCDMDGRILVINRAFKELYGFAPDQVPAHLKECGYYVYRPGTREPCSYEHLPLVRAMSGEATDDVELDLITSHHPHPRLMSVTGRPLKGATGYQGGVIVLRDVSVQKRNETALRESESRFRAIFHAQFQFIGLMSPDGTLLEANRGALALVGLCEADVVGKPFWETAWWTHDEIQRERVREAVFLAAAGESVRFETHHPTVDGRLLWVDFSLSAFRDEAGRVLFLIPEGRDITERKQAEASLRASEERFRCAFEYAPIGVSLTATDGRWLQVNRSLCELTGYSERELLATDFQAITHPDDPGNDMAHLQQFLAGTVQDYQAEKRYFHKRGHLVHVHLSVSLVRDDGGSPLYFICHIMDITHRKETEAALRLSEERFRRLVEGVAGHAIFMLDTEGHVVSWNPAAVQIKGYNAAEIVGRHFSAFYTPEAVAAEHPQYELAVAVAEGRYAEEGERVRKDGSRFWADVTISVLRDHSGHHVGFVKFTHDITQRKRSEEQIRASLREKEVLLKEIHHRVKNNLQIVSALLGLQAEHTTDPATLGMFAESQGRVQSMALIHERLYRSKDMARVDFAEYIRGLAADLYHTYKVSEDEIALDLAVDAPPLGIDIAIPCGLILNELISNCFKHAFAGATEGRLWVSLRRSEHGGNVLTVADNGPGFPKGYDPGTAKSFGMQLVSTLVEQLHGELGIAFDHGTAITVTFPATKT